MLSCFVAPTTVMAPATAMALLRVPAEVSQKLSFTLENFLLRAHSALLQDGCSRYNLVIKKKKKKIASEWDICMNDLIFHLLPRTFFKRKYLLVFSQAFSL